jgi:hypothetical protein
LIENLAVVEEALASAVAKERARSSALKGAAA